MSSLRQESTIPVHDNRAARLRGPSVWPWLEPSDHLGSLPTPSIDWPRISIVTPNFNYGHLIEMTMRSVILQDYPNLEYIVIDDGSTDNSVELIQKYSSKLAYFEHQPNQGQYPTINKGFSKATGEICAWLNSDDIYLPWTLRMVATVFLQFPEVHWIAGRFTGIQDGVIHQIGGLRAFPRPMIRAGLFHDEGGGYGFIQQESCFWRRGLWERAGGLKEDLRYAADFELWTRFAQYYDLHAVSTVLGGFSFRGNENRSRANWQQFMDDVDKTVREIRRDRRSTEARLARRIALHEFIRYRVGRRIATRLFPVDDLRGPTLTWDFSQRRYVAGSARLF